MSRLGEDSYDRFVNATNKCFEGRNNLGVAAMGYGDETEMTDDLKEKISKQILEPLSERLVEGAKVPYFGINEKRTEYDNFLDEIEKLDFSTSNLDFENGYRFKTIKNDGAENGK